MSSILIILGIAAFGAFLMHLDAENFKINSPPNLPILGSISRDELDWLWVDNRRRLFGLMSQPSKYSTSYISKLLSLGELLKEKLLEIHEENFGKECVPDLMKKATWVTHGANRLNLFENLNLTNFSADEIAALAFHFYRGRYYNTKEIVNSPKILMKYVDYLIEINCAQGYLLKGIMLKYGLDIDARPFSRESLQYFELASDYGIGSAKSEVIYLHRYFELDDFPDGVPDAKRLRWY